MNKKRKGLKNETLREAGLQKLLERKCQPAMRMCVTIFTLLGRTFLRSTALTTALIFLLSQVVFAIDAIPFEQNLVQTVQPTTNVNPAVSGDTPSQPTSPTTLDFLAGQNSPLSSALVEQASANVNPVVVETQADGSKLFHVYEGESIQEAIVGASSGDTVYLHAGTYHEHVILKDGVSLQGEDAQSTILHGDYQSQVSVIIAQGNNRIEGLTITGSGPYAGMPSSAIRVEGDNVKIRDNQIINNQDYGIHIWTGNNTLIEMNFF